MQLQSLEKWYPLTICHFLDLNESEDIHQNINLTIAEHGGTVTLPCAVSEDCEIIYWYKQTIGHMPQLVANKIKIGGHKIYLGKLFSAQIITGNFILKIQNITSSDRGIYFSVKAVNNKMEFRNGTFVAARGMYTL